MHPANVLGILNITSSEFRNSQAWY